MGCSEVQRQESLPDRRFLEPVRLEVLLFAWPRLVPQGRGFIEERATLVVIRILGRFGFQGIGRGFFSSKMPS